MVLDEMSFLVFAVENKRLNCQRMWEFPGRVNLLLPCCWSNGAIREREVKTSSYDEQTSASLPVYHILVHKGIPRSICKCGQFSCLKTTVRNVHGEICTPTFSKYFFLDFTYLIPTFELNS
jgi:hypothetical protein